MGHVLKGKEQDLDLMNSMGGTKIMKKRNLQKTEASSLKKITNSKHPQSRPGHLSRKRVPCGWRNSTRK